MNSIFMSVGKLFQVSLFLGVICLVGCQSGPKSALEMTSNPADMADELSEEISLKADRDQLNEVRKDVPKNKRIANDELSMDLELLAVGDEKPTRIRSQFQGKVSKLRSKFRKQSQTIRTKFRDTQKKQRDAFLKRLKAEREEFNQKKPEREKTREFYSQQDLERKDFFAEQKDQRKEFDSKMREKSKDFHANMKERIRQFEEQLRLYRKNYNAKRAEERKAKREARKDRLKSSKPGGPYFKSNAGTDEETQKIMDEFSQMEKKASQPLKTQ